MHPTSKLLEAPHSPKTCVLAETSGTVYNLTYVENTSQIMCKRCLGIRTELPRICKSSSQNNQSLYDNSFAVIGPHVWNTLPGQLYKLGDLTSFKDKLTDYLTTIPDNPPAKLLVAKVVQMETIFSIESKPEMTNTILLG